MTHPSAALFSLVALLAPALASAQEITTAQRMQGMFLIPRPPRMPPPPPGEHWVWVPPTYETVYDRIWQPPSIRTITETIWIPDRMGWRTICYWDNGQYVQRQEWGVLTPGHFETRTRDVETPGQWVTVPRRTLITPGHWEWRGPGRPPGLPLPPTNPPSSTGRPPGLEPFSPLWEWPEEKR